MKFKMSWKPVLWIFLLISTGLLLFPGATGAAAGEKKGELKVYNETDRDLYISVGSQAEGTVTSKSSREFECKYGQHRVTAEWDGGMIETTIFIYSGNPKVEWTIVQDDLR
jgi:hypothetical protein